MKNQSSSSEKLLKIVSAKMLTVTKFKEKSGGQCWYAKRQKYDKQEVKWAWDELQWRQMWLLVYLKPTDNDQKTAGRHNLFVCTLNMQTKSAKTNIDK